MDNHEARITVLEKLSENCDLQRSDTNKRLDNLEDKLDKHLEMSSSSQIEMTRSVTRLVTTVETMADDLKTALHGSVLAVKHETVARVLLWIGGIAVTAIGGGWAVFVFLASRS